MRVTLLAAALAGLLGAGCATTRTYPPPTPNQLAAAESAVSAARAAGAQADPRASLHLQRAQQQLSQAKDSLAAGDNRSAALLLSRAEADAELSQMLQREAKANAEAEEVERRLEAAKAPPAVEAN